MNSDTDKLPHIHSLAIEKKGLLNKKSFLILNGTLPSPAFEIKDMQCRVQHDSLLITPILSYDPHKVVIQISIYFKKEFDLSPFLKENEIHSVHLQSDHGLVSLQL